VNGTSWRQSATVGPNVTSYVSDLKGSGLRYFRVRAYNNVGNSDYSKTAHADTTSFCQTPTPTPVPSATPTTTPPPTPTSTPTPASTPSPTPTPTSTPVSTPTPSPTPTPTPDAPTNLTVTAVSRSQINLSWTDHSNNETGFKVERTRRGNSFKRIATVGANVTTYADTGLKASTTYRYRVRAYNSGGNSDYSNIASATTATASTPTPTPSPTPTPTPTPIPTPTPTSFSLGYSRSGSYVTLRWNGADTDSVLIWRSGKLVTRAGNDGKYVDRMPMRGQYTAYIYQVCEYAGNQCSNKVTVPY
jgi:hypothetical protein